MSKVGKFNYEAYREFSGGRSLVSGEPIPAYDDLPQAIQGAWDWAAVRLAGYLDGNRDGRLAALLDGLATLWENRADIADAKGNHQAATTLRGTAGELRDMLGKTTVAPPLPEHLARDQ